MLIGSSVRSCSYETSSPHRANLDKCLLGLINYPTNCPALRWKVGTLSSHRRTSSTSTARWKWAGGWLTLPSSVSECNISNYLLPLSVAASTPLRLAEGQREGTAKGEHRLQTATYLNVGFNDFLTVEGQLICFIDAVQWNPDSVCRNAASSSTQRTPGWNSVFQSFCCVV